jgi:hypothetical protein
LNPEPPEYEAGKLDLILREIYNEGAKWIAQDGVNFWFCDDSAEIWEYYIRVNLLADWHEPNEGTQSTTRNILAFDRPIINQTGILGA